MAVRALVIYGSMFGNTRAVAQAVADGLSGYAEVDLREVSGAPYEIGPDVDLLVVGGPTHAFAMSRTATRAEAAKQAGDGLVSPGDGIREWMAVLSATPGVAVATFDTRMRSSWFTGSAAKGARKSLRSVGFDVSPGSTSYFVGGTRGPLLDDEQARARVWGQTLGLAGGESAAAPGAMNLTVARLEPALAPAGGVQVRSNMACGPVTWEFPRSDVIILGPVPDDVLSRALDLVELTGDCDPLTSSACATNCVRGRSGEWSYRLAGPGGR